MKNFDLEKEVIIFLKFKIIKLIYLIIWKLHHHKLLYM